MFEELISQLEKRADEFREYRSRDAMAVVHGIEDDIKVLQMAYDYTEEDAQRVVEKYAKNDDGGRQ